MTGTVTISPAKIDGQIAQALIEMQRVEREITRATDAIHTAAGDTRGVRTGWKMSTDEARLLLTPAAQRDLTRTEVLARIQYARFSGQVEALQAIYRAHGWTRYYFCTNTNGHIHSDERACPTLRPTTQMAWHPELSGLTGAEVVEQVGPAMCTVCYPDAPAGHTSSNLTEIERRRTAPERDVAKAERDEKKARKQLTPDEQFRTRHGSERIETVAACQKVIRDAIDREVEAEFYAGRTAAQSGWTDEGAYAQFLANIARSRDEQYEDAHQAAAVLITREDEHEGYGMTAEAIAQLRARKAKASRREWFANA